MEIGKIASFRQWMLDTVESEQDDIENGQIK
jgi:hypothetical protein